MFPVKKTGASIQVSNLKKHISRGKDDCSILWNCDKINKTIPWDFVSGKKEAFL